MATVPPAHADTLATSHRSTPMAAMELTFSQTFELERMRREIDATQDPQQLRELSKELLRAWFSEKASTNQAIRDQLGDG
jgi:recombinational DNA repair protein (RecF pathway)